MVDILILYFYLAQHLVPASSALQAELFHISLSQLLYVQPSLLLTDERRSYASLYLFASLTYLEGDDGTHMVAFLLVSFLVFAILDTKHSVKVMVELDDKVISEVCWYATAITSGKAHHLALVRQYLDIATLIESIDNDMSTIGLREGESHQRSTLRRTEFCCHVVVGEIYTIIIRCHLLCLMREPTGSLLLIENRFSYNRHQRELTVVIDPRTGLMRLLQSSYLLGSISILPSIAHLSCLGNPEVHAPRHGDGRICIACGKPVVGVGAHQGLHEVHRILYIHLDSLRHQGEKYEYKHN